MTGNKERPRKGGSFIRGDDGRLKPAPKQAPEKTPEKTGAASAATKTTKEG